MKKIIFISLAFLFQNFAFAQIVNGGFEDLNPANQPIHWVPKFFSFPVLMDSLGLPTSDSIVFDGFMNAINKDNPNSGKNAYEMRSLYNYTLNKGLAPAVRAMADSTTMGFFAGGFPYQPVLNKLQFYYRFQSQLNDTAFASFVIFDDNEEEMYRADFDLLVYTSGYRQMSKNIEFISSKQPAYASLVFATCKPESNPHLGSRLLIDDVSLSSVNSILETSNSGFRFFPNPVKNKLFIQSQCGDKIEKVTIYDLNGSLVLTSINVEEIDLNSLMQGVYFLNIRSNFSSVTKKIIKE